VPNLVTFSLNSTPQKKLNIEALNMRSCGTRIYVNMDRNDSHPITTRSRILFVLSIHAHHKNKVCGENNDYCTNTISIEVLLNYVYFESNVVDSKI
jgi:hypothetical protein